MQSQYESLFQLHHDTKGEPIKHCSLFEHFAFTNDIDVVL